MSESSKDFLLSALVHFLNGSKTSLRVRILVGGTLIQGETIAEDEYLSEISNWFDSEMMKAALERNRMLREELSGAMIKAGETASDADPSGLPSYIHLTNVAVVYGNKAGVRFGDGRLRLRIDAIDGFFLGDSEIKS